MKQPNHFLVNARRGSARLELSVCLALLGCPLALNAAEAADIMVKPPVPIAGGLSLHPVITSVTRTQDVVTVQWFGIQGPFQVLHSTAANDQVWEPLGTPTFRSRMSVSLPGGDPGFFRVLSGRAVSTEPTGGTMNYVGASACIDCHGEAHSKWSGTGHATALHTLKAIRQDKNSACLVCHTVGFGTPLGFKDESTTPHLAGVQCESCHGPGGNHVANPRDPSARPKVTVAAEVCGGCHNDFHHPTFDEFKLSAHATPTEDVSESILQQGEPRMRACGACHSGAVRTALLKEMQLPGTPMPHREDAAFFGITCVACHDAHSQTPTPRTDSNPQLRNPLFSTVNFSFSTSSEVSFASQYNPNVQLCAQCHNMRGARWQDTSRPPHHSPQYNMLIGKGAHDLGKPIISAHGEIATQCVHCHTHPHGADPLTADNPNYTGHDFKVQIETCADCHINTTTAGRIVTRTQRDIRGEIQAVRALLDTWATQNAPEELRAKYGRLAWEYTTAGQISNPEGTPGVRGPSAAEQLLIPDAIKQARMNLYLVEHDGSYGIHNGAYARHLLNVAKTNVASASVPE